MEFFFAALGRVSPRLAGRLAGFRQGFRQGFSRGFRQGFRQAFPQGLSPRLSARKTPLFFAPLPTLRDRHLRRLGHDPYQRKSIPEAFRLSVYWGEFNEMNASARREDLLAYWGCAWPRHPGRPSHQTRRRSFTLRSFTLGSSTLGWMLLTGLTCTSPLHTYAADWLSSGQSDAATTTTSAAAPTLLTAPTPPLPPSPLATTTTTTTTAKPAAGDQAKNQDTAQANTPANDSANALAKAVGKAPAQAQAAITTTWQSLTTWITPPSMIAKTPSQPKAADRSAAPATAIGASAASPARARPSTSRPTTTVGRFDPEFGPTGHFVTDGTEVATQAPLATQAETMQRVASPRQAVAPETQALKEQSAVATDESVSLVSWLSNYAGGGHGGTADVCPDVCLTDNCCPTWEAQIDALFLWQGNIPSRPLYVETASGATALDANQLYAPVAIAPRYALTYHRDDCRAIEVNYFQVWGFNAQQAVGPTIDGAGEGIYTASSLVGPDYDRVASARATSSANIQSLEVNLRRTDGGMIEWISGFRWLQWGQNLNITDNTVENGVSSGDDLVNINTLNSLYGWQWGGDMMLWNAGRWLRVNGIAKAGVYYNHQASQNTYYTDFVEPDVNVASANDTVSFVGETGINASLALTNWLSWRAGYTCFWLGGVATPARQLGLTNIDASTTSINTNGSVFLHGVNTGLEARW